MSICEEAADRTARQLALGADLNKLEDNGAAFDAVVFYRAAQLHAETLEKSAAVATAVQDAVRVEVEGAEKVGFSCSLTALDQKWQGWAERALNGVSECRCEDCLESNKKTVAERARKIAAKNAAQSEVAG